MHKKAPIWAWVLATGMGSGFIKPAPGTWGSLTGLLTWIFVTKILAMLIVLPMQLYINNFIFLSILIEIVYFGLYIALIKLAIFISELVINETYAKDPSYIVIDEWVGIWITLWPLHWHVIYDFQTFFAQPLQLVITLLIALITFRIFDIWKPWPIQQIQILDGAYGIVVDDLVAGLYSIPIFLVLIQWLNIKYNVCNLIYLI